MKVNFRVIVMVYVDDIIILSDRAEGINWAKVELKFLFKLTYSESLQYYSGVSSQRMESSMPLSQRLYVQIILD